MQSVPRSRCVDVDVRAQALAYNAAAAGFVMLSMVNFVLLIIVGFEKDASPVLYKQPLLGDSNPMTEQI